jgi:glycosyltransferase involved in cell wall biosynthesis
VVSERNAFPNKKKRWLCQLRHFHRLADVVTTNSKTNRKYITETVSSLESKVYTIYNAVDLNFFRPSGNKSLDLKVVKVVVLSSVKRNKNLVGVLRALTLLRERLSLPSLRVKWFGATASDTSHYKEAKSLIAENHLENLITIHPPTQDVRAAYWDSDAVMLPSFYEGLPNSVCEGMACGKPVLASNVCDNSSLIVPDGNGFLFDPESPESISEAIQKFCLVSAGQRISMGKKSREMAESLFDPNRFADSYLDLLRGSKLESQ